MPATTKKLNNVLLVGDVHYGSVFTDLLDKILLNEIVNVVHSHDVDGVVFLGDLLHTTQSLYEFLSPFCKMISDIDCPIFIVSGNHDMDFKGKSLLKFANNLRNVRVIDSPEEHDDCLFLPHMRTGFTTDKRYRAVFAHLGHQKWFYENEAKYDGKDIITVPDDVNVVLGHLHKPGRVGDKVFIPGSLVPVSFLPSHHQRGLYLYNIDSGQILPVFVYSTFCGFMDKSTYKKLLEDGLQLSFKQLCEIPTDKASEIAVNLSIDYSPQSITMIALFQMSSKAYAYVKEIEHRRIKQPQKHINVDISETIKTFIHQKGFNPQRISLLIKGITGKGVDELCKYAE